MSRSNGLALALAIATGVLATLTGVVRTFDDRMLHADEVAAQGLETLISPAMINVMNGPVEAKVRNAFVAVVKPRPPDSFVRTRRALVASGDDAAVQDAVRRSLVEQHAAVLRGDVPATLALDTTPRRAPFIAAWGTEPEFTTILNDHLNLEPQVRFAHGWWIDALSVTLRTADALAPFLPLLAGLVALLAVATVLAAADRRTGLRRAGVALLSAAGCLYLLFDALVGVFLRATRSVEAELAGRMFKGLTETWTQPAALLAVAGLVLVVVSIALRRAPAPAPVAD